MSAALFGTLDRDHRRLFRSNVDVFKLEENPDLSCERMERCGFGSKVSVEMGGGRVPRTLLGPSFMIEEVTAAV